MTETHEFDIEAIRLELAKLQEALNWYGRRGGLMPYDWNTYGCPHVVKLLELCRVRFDGKLRKKDKRGAWR